MIKVACWWLTLGLATTCLGQTSRQAFGAEMSLPFGVAPGKLVLSDGHLIFFDTDQPETSFVVHREDVQNVEDQGGLLTIQLARPVRDRSGERSRLSFRPQLPSASAAVSSWFRMSPAVSGTVDRQAGSVSQNYQVRHNHRLGGCNGRFIVSGDRIVYESITDVDHSRHWAMKDIKEMKRSSPYKIEIRPFNGAHYTFELSGTGMDNADYETLVRSITAARINR
jgi:hypothetical protein